LDIGYSLLVIGYSVYPCSLYFVFILTPFLKLFLTTEMVC